MQLYCMFTLLYQTTMLTCTLFQESDREGEPAVAVGLLGQGPQPGMASVAIVPPTTGDDYDSDGSSGSEDEQRPLTQQELKNKILKGVSQFFSLLSFLYNIMRALLLWTTEFTRRHYSEMSVVCHARGITPNEIEQIFHRTQSNEIGI